MLKQKHGEDAALHDPRELARALAVGASARRHDTIGTVSVCEFKKKQGGVCTIDNVGLSGSADGEWARAVATQRGAEHFLPARLPQNTSHLPLFHFSSSDFSHDV